MFVFFFSWNFNSLIFYFFLLNLFYNFIFSHSFSSSIPSSLQINNQIYLSQNISSSNSIIGLALYKNFLSGFHRLVGSLRGIGYHGHIILGVNSLISSKELNYLKRNEVTLYGVEIIDCHQSAMISNQENHGIIRGKCSKDLPNLKLEWGRYEMARRWLEECKECIGWSMIIDTRDIFFQADPVRF